MCFVFAVTLSKAGRTNMVDTTKGGKENKKNIMITKKGRRERKGCEDGSECKQELEKK
jgi:hypothetical protein